MGRHVASGEAGGGQKHERREHRKTGCLRHLEMIVSAVRHGFRSLGTFWALGDDCTCESRQQRLFLTLAQMAKLSLVVKSTYRCLLRTIEHQPCQGCRKRLADSKLTALHRTTHRVCSLLIFLTPLFVDTVVRREFRCPEMARHGTIDDALHILRNLSNHAYKPRTPSRCCALRVGEEARPRATSSMATQPPGFTGAVTNWHDALL